MTIEIIEEEERLVWEGEGARIFYRRIGMEQGTRIGRVDDEERQRELIDYIIVDWEEVVHPITKEPVPCIRENKLKLPQRILIGIMELASDLRGRGQDLKNLPTT